jgi:hypothetical protein
MSKHPFFHLHIDILGQIQEIYKLERIEQSKLVAMGENGGITTMGSLNVSFSTQVNT